MKSEGKEIENRKSKENLRKVKRKKTVEERYRKKKKKINKWDDKEWLSYKYAL